MAPAPSLRVANLLAESGFKSEWVAPLVITFQHTTCRDHAEHAPSAAKAKKGFRNKAEHHSPKSKLPCPCRTVGRSLAPVWIPPQPPESSSLWGPACLWRHLVLELPKLRRHFIHLRGKERARRRAKKKAAEASIC